MADEDDRGRPGTGARLLLVAIIAVALATLLISIYLMMDAPDPVRGAQGPLQQNSPGHDPPSSTMR